VQLVRADCKKMIRASACRFYCIFALMQVMRSVLSFSSSKIGCGKQSIFFNVPLPRQNSVKCNMVENSLLTLTAGAFAGSIGVGVAYPLDALKTKAQTYASSKDAAAGSMYNILELYDPLPDI
jgi:Mitochondrial carrier protein